MFRTSRHTIESDDGVIQNEANLGRRRVSDGFLGTFENCTGSALWGRVRDSGSPWKHIFDANGTILLAIQLRFLRIFFQLSGPSSPARDVRLRAVRMFAMTVSCVAST